MRWAWFVLILRRKTEEEEEEEEAVAGLPEGATMQDAILTCCRRAGLCKDAIGLGYKKV